MRERTHLSELMLGQRDLGRTAWATQPSCAAWSRDLGGAAWSRGLGSATWGHAAWATWPRSRGVVWLAMGCLDQVAVGCTISDDLLSFSFLYSY